MGFLWSKPVKYWVPEDRKLKDLLDEDQQRWKTATDLTGWQIQNSLDNNFADSVLNTVATTEINLSFNGLGDDECEHLARIVKSSKIIKRLILENRIPEREKERSPIGYCVTPSGKSQPTTPRPQCHPVLRGKQVDQRSRRARPPPQLLSTLP